MSLADVVARIVHGSDEISHLACLITYDSAFPGKLQRATAMLVLTRRTGEEIKIGDDITLVVLGVKGQQVRLGVTAPKDVAVHREEVYERIMAEAATRAPK